MTKAFRTLLFEAIKHFAETGYRSEADLNDWLMKLHRAIEREMPGDEYLKALVTAALESVYRREIAGITKLVPGVGRYTLDRVDPHLRAELDRRIFAGIDLIKLNKRAATDRTLKRFSGWVTSIPQTGSSEDDLRSVTTDIGKSVSQVKYEARRVAIDQGHKLSAAVARTVATGQGAIAAVWHSNWRQPNYDYRPDHKARDQRVYLLRNSWALDEGLVKTARVGYLEDITQPGEEVFCQCVCTYITTLPSLPSEMLTAKGRAALARAAVA